MGRTVEKKFKIWKTIEDENGIIAKSLGRANGGIIIQYTENKGKVMAGQRRYIDRKSSEFSEIYKRCLG